MTPKVLFTTTLALALLSSVAMAEDSKPLTRAAVVADYQRAAADGTLRKTDYDDDTHEQVRADAATRAQVVADMTVSRTGNKLVGPMRSRTYNPYGSEMLRPSVVTRHEVKTQVVGAMRDGSLRRSDYDDVPVSVSRRTRDRAVGAFGS